MKRTRATTHRPVELEIRTDDLPPGVCGRIQGIALPYGVTDYYNTRFAKGCLDRTRSEKLAAGKVKLLADHWGVTGNHVGVVRSMPDVGDAAAIAADLFDTEAGRKALEYAKAVVAARAFTGFSIGFFERDAGWITEPDGTRVYEFREIELDEVSLTPSPAIPGAELMGARHTPGIAAGNTTDKHELLRIALRGLVETLPEADVRAAVQARFGDAKATDSNAPTERTSERDSDAGAEDSREGQTPSFATMEDRLAALRTSYAA